MPKICDAAACAKFALDKAVCDAVGIAAVNFYTVVKDYIRETTCIDLSIIVKAIAVLSLVCWIQNWLVELVKAIIAIPKFVKNLFCGRFSLCVFDGCESPAPKPDDSDSDSDSDSKSHKY